MHRLLPLFTTIVIGCSAFPAATDSTDATHKKPHTSDSDASDDADDDGVPDARDPWKQSFSKQVSAPCVAAPSGPVDSSSVDAEFMQNMRAGGVPGMAVAIVGQGRIKFMKGYGFANVEQQRPVTVETLFMLASVSKTITSVALMQLVENPQNGINLDDDVSAKAGFTVRNPNFPNTPVTYRMLLTHTSSLIDSDTYWATSEPANAPEGDNPTPIADFERGYVARRDSWSTSEPGTEFSYSNTAVGLIGALVQAISQQDFDTYSKQHIFNPLGMGETSWFFKNLNRDHIATPYRGAGPFQPITHYGYPDFPSGQLRTSVSQLANFLAMFMQKGTCGNARILSEATAMAMRQDQLGSLKPDQGLIWYGDAYDNVTPFGHNGADKGVSTFMFFDRETSNGYIMLTNASTTLDGSEQQQDAMYAIADRLYELANTMQ